MSRLTKGIAAKKAGAAPGTLIHIGQKKAERVKITLIDYGPETFYEGELESIDACLAFIHKPTITWINIDGLHDIEFIEKIGKLFNLHPLIMEDIVDTRQRPKLEDFEDYLFFTFKMLFFGDGDQIVKFDQISLILGDRFLISFQEMESDIFSPVRERIRRTKGRIRKMGCDYLAYSLIDATVDHYFSILEILGARIEILEEEIQSKPTAETLKRIYQLKREMIYLRKHILPMREIVTVLQKNLSPLIGANISPFLTDVYDHTIQIMDAVESFRDILTGLLDVYLSTVSNRLNEVVKVLTIISTLFIPLTFLAGVYGMNFKYMPELEWRWGYFSVLSIMVIVALLMIFYFKKKKWL